MRLIDKPTQARTFSQVPERMAGLDANRVVNPLTTGEFFAIIQIVQSIRFTNKEKQDEQTANEDSRIF